MLPIKLILPGVEMGTRYFKHIIEPKKKHTINAIFGIQHNLNVYVKSCLDICVWKY